MSQIKNNGALPEVTVTNASQAVILHDYNAVAELVAGQSFHVQGEADGYEVSSATPTWDGTNTTCYLTGVYGGTTKGGLGSGVYGIVATGYTTPDNISEMDVGDVDTAFIVTRAFRKIQDIFTAIVNGTKDLTSVSITGFKNAAVTRAALGVAIGTDVAAYVKDNTSGALPTVNDDTTQGYTDDKSRWYHTGVTPTDIYFLADGTPGAAVWEKLNLVEADLGSMAVQDASAVAITGGSADIEMLSNKPPTTGGTGSEYTVTLGISALETGRVYRVNLHTANTDIAPTLAADGLAAVTIKTADGDSIVEGLLYAGTHDFLYDGTVFLVVGFKPSLLRRVIVSDAAVTNIDIDGLDINKHGTYRISVEVINAVSSAGNLHLFVSNAGVLDTVITNYYTQSTFIVGAAAPVTNRANTPSVVGMDAVLGQVSTASIFLHKSNMTGAGYVGAESQVTRDIGSSVSTHIFNYSKTSAVDNITKIRFGSSVASAIDVNSVVSVYRG